MPIESVPPSTYHLIDQDHIAAELGGDVGAQLAALLLTSARDSREAARAERSEEEANLREAEAHQVELMLEQAESVRAAGTARAYGMMVSGAVNVTGSAAAMAIDLDQPGSPLGQEIQGSLAGGGKLVEGTFDFDATCSDFAADIERAQATTMANLAAESTRRLDDAKAAEADARELARTALEFLRNVNQLEAGSDQASLYLLRG